MEPNDARKLKDAAFAAAIKIEKLFAEEKIDATIGLLGMCLMLARIAHPSPDRAKVRDLIDDAITAAIKDMDLAKDLTKEQLAEMVAAMMPSNTTVQ